MLDLRTNTLRRHYVGNPVGRHWHAPCGIVHASSSSTDGVVRVWRRTMANRLNLFRTTVFIRMISGCDIQKYLLAEDVLGSLILQGSSQETCVYRVSFGGRLLG